MPWETTDVLAFSRNFPVPTLQRFLAAYRKVFCRYNGFERVSRYINGLLLSTNKTLQEIYVQIVCPTGHQVSRRAMHEAVFEAG